MTTLALSETSEAELRSIALEMLARRLFEALRDAAAPTHPRGCMVCKELLSEAEFLFRELVEDKQRAVSVIVVAP